MLSRVEPLPRTELPESVRQLVDEWEDALGFVPTSFLAIGRKPEILQAAGALTNAVLAPGAVSRELKWLVAHMASKAAGCRYCSAHTVSNATSHGSLSAEKAAAVWEFETSPLFTDAERVAMRLGLAAGVTPNAVEDEHFDALREHYDEEQIVELVAALSLFGWWNRWNDTMATQLEATPAAYDRP